MESGEFLRCSRCGKLTDVRKSDVEESEWDRYVCSECEGEEYGQVFVNWIQDRISPSTSEDTTGRFVLRELVQNADDVEAEIMVLRFCKKALYVYNDGFGFRSSVDNGPGDFERISSVLAKPKEKEFYTSGNFGTGFQTVYLFTNFPEVHSNGKSFRYDPTGPKKEALAGKDKIGSPYHDRKNKGAVFRLPWRTERNAVVKDKFFKDKELWKRWDEDDTYELFKELREYLHDSLLCCQHLKKIRIIWEGDNVNEGYQAERDFILKYIDNDGKIGKVTEGKGRGGLLPEDWKYEDKKEFKYFIGSTFVSNRSVKEDNITIIHIKNEDDKTSKMDIKTLTGSSCRLCKESYERYFESLKKENAIKKSDIHILIPLFKWEKRVGEKRRKAWTYSVIPLPKESGNNFTFTAHLFPKQTRESFEIHQEEAKREWLENVLQSGARLFLRTYELYIKMVHGMEELDDETKQAMILDYLPAQKLSDWVKVPLDDTEKKAKFLFGWDRIPGNDNDRLRETLIHDFGIDWAKNAKIEKTDRGKIIRVITVKNQILLKLNDENTEVSLIYGARTSRLSVKMENNDINIYEPPLDEYVFAEVFSKEILVSDGEWHTPLGSEEFIPFPRNEKERWLLDKMDIVTFTDSFLKHPRFKELQEFRKRLMDEIAMTDGRFESYYNKYFFDQIKDTNGKVTYGSATIDKELIENLIEHCLVSPCARIMDSLKIIPNKQGTLCSPKELRKEPEGDFRELRSIIPSYLYPHEDFESKVKVYINEINDPIELLEGIKENKVILENDTKLTRMCYEWLEKSDKKLPKDIKDYPLVLDDNGHMVPINDVFWTPTHHHDLIKDFLISQKGESHLVSKSILTDFEDFICKSLKVQILDYHEIITKYRNAIEGTEQQKIELQAIMAEGIMLGLANRSWQADEVNELHFLPGERGIGNPS